MLKKIKEIYKKYEEIINYIVIGILTTIISLGTKYGLLFTILDAKNAVQLQIAVVVSWFLAVLFAYFANRKIVFKSKNKKVVKEMIMFFGARVATLVMEAFLMWLFVTMMKLNSDIQVIFITIIVQVFILVGNYILSKFLVFKRS